MRARTIASIALIGAVFFLAEVAILRHFAVVLPEHQNQQQPAISVIERVGDEQLPWFAWNPAGVVALEQALFRQQEYLRQCEHSGKRFVFAGEVLTAERIRASARIFLDIVRTSSDAGDFNKRIRARFDVYQPAGSDQFESVMATGYYTPCYEGSFTQTDRYRYPLYIVPPDLRVADLGEFLPSLRGERLVYRIDDEHQRIIPYYSRRDIAEGEVLRGKNLELLYLENELDCFLLMLEGSGKIRLQDGTELYVAWAGDNGRTFRSVQQMLITDGHLSPSELNQRGLSQFFHENPRAISRYLYANERYIFFERQQEGPRGAGDVILTPMHSVALDLDIFPLGVLVYLSPMDTSSGPNGSSGLFLLCQDTGVLINGTTRADVYFGAGQAAQELAEQYRRECLLHILLLR